MTDQKIAARVAAMENTLHVLMTLLTERGALRDGDIEVVRVSAAHRARDRVSIPSDEIVRAAPVARAVHRRRYSA